MKVTVRLAGGLVHTLGFSEQVLELPPGATAGDLLDAIKADRSRPLIVGRDGWAIDLADELHEGERILISPVFSGG